tara:strand:- start:769 stop:1287 length:519 start_codon:yes stop_codon:yes gene_type:complete
MANCPITSGRVEPCNDSIGGLDSFFAIPFIVNGFTIADGEVTAIDSGITEAFKFELRADANTFTSDGVSDENTGVSLFTETLTVFLKKQDALTNVQVNLLQQGLHYFICKSRNGGYQLMGSLDGARVTASNIVSGGARSDGNGYNLTATSTSKTPAPFLDQSTVTALLAIVQ